MNAEQKHDLAQTALECLITQYETNLSFYRASLGRNVSLRPLREGVIQPAQEALFKIANRGRFTEQTLEAIKDLVG